MSKRAVLIALWCAWVIYLAFTGEIVPAFLRGLCLLQ